MCRYRTIVIAFVVALGACQQALAATVQVSGGGNSLQNAIDSAAVSDTLEVVDALAYNPITVDKGLTIRAADGVVPEIDARGSSVGVAIEASDVVLEGFDIVGDDATVVGVSVRYDSGATGNITIRDNEIHGMAMAGTGSGTSSVGVLGWGSSNTMDGLIVRDNIIRDIGGGDDTNPVGAAVALEELTGSGATVEGNLIRNIVGGTDNDADGQPDPGTGVAVLPEVALGATTADSFVVSDTAVAAVRSNVFTDVELDVLIGGDVGDAHINRNDFGDGSGLGLAARNTSNGAVDATDNFWGHVSGPADAADVETSVEVDDNRDCTADPAQEVNVDGQGDVVDDAGGGGNPVDYCPWSQVANLATGEHFGSIQAAIDDTDTLAGHTIEVAGGVYDENVVVDKPGIVLSGAAREDGPDAAMIEGRVEIAADDVVVERLRIAPSTTFIGDIGTGFGVLVNGASGVDVRNNLIEGLRGAASVDTTSSFTLHGIQVFSCDATPDRNITVRANRIVDVENNGDSSQWPLYGGAVGVKVQGNVSGVDVVNNRIQDVHSAGWAFGLTVTGSGGCPATPPADVTVELNKIGAVNDGSVFSVNADSAPFEGVNVEVDDNPGADAGEVTASCNNLAGSPLGALNKEGQSMMAENNWWGQADGPAGDGPGSGAAVVGAIDFEPFLTTLMPAAQNCNPGQVFDSSFEAP